MNLSSEALNRCTQLLLRYFCPCFNQIHFQRFHSCVWWATDLSFQHGPNTEVHWVEIGWWRRPHFLAPKLQEIFSAPSLGFFGGTLFYQNQISKFLTLQLKPWQMLVSGDDKQLTCLQERPLSVGPSLCCFVDWSLAPQWIFFFEKTISPFCMPDFSKFQRRSSISTLFCCWKLMFFSFKGESLRSIFTIVLIDFGSI